MHVFIPAYVGVCVKLFARTGVLRGGLLKAFAVQIHKEFFNTLDQTAQGCVPPRHNPLPLVHLVFASTVHTYTIYDRIFGDCPAKIPYTPYKYIIYSSG